MARKFLLAAFFLLAGCKTLITSSIEPSIGANGRLAAQMEFTLDNAQYSGTAIVPRKLIAPYKFVFEFPGKPKVLFVNSCAREEVYWAPAAKMRYDYNPDTFEEQIGLCLLMFTLVNDAGEYHRAVIDFKNPDTKLDLSTQVFCNGIRANETGSFLCQIRTGLEAVVNVSGAIEQSGNCDMLRVGNDYRIKARSGFCVQVFEDTSTGARFRIVVLGYDTILNVFPMILNRKTEE